MAKKQRPEVPVVIPVLNESKTIAGDLRNILRLLGTAIPKEPELRQQPYLTDLNTQ
jgi:hypothetical protein